MSLQHLVSTHDNAPIVYQIQPISPQKQQVEVLLTLSGIATTEIELQLPNWIPGSYMIRDFAKNILEFEASSSTGKLTYQRTSKSAWLIHTQGAETIQVRYLVYAADLSVRSAYLNDEFGFFNPTSVCLQVSHLEHLPHTVRLLPPPQQSELQWTVSTTLPRMQVDESGFGEYQATSYEDLIDYPILMGKLQVLPFEVNGIPHELVLQGRHFAHAEKLATALQAICLAQYQFWGTLPYQGFQEYKFLTIVTEQEYGGLEHKNSTALMCARSDLECFGDINDHSGFQDFLALCSHEYFHSWNIKQLKPKQFLPYSLQNESYTQQLWFYEGVTSFYDDLFLYLSGCVSAKTYLQRLSLSLSRAVAGKGPQRQTLAESSYLAWTTFYQQNANAVNAISNYYTKGAVFALCLDLQLRQSPHSTDLRSVLTSLFQNIAERQQGTDMQILLDYCNPHQDPAVKQLLQQGLFSTEELPWEALLNKHGIHVQYSSLHALTQHPRNQSISGIQVDLHAALNVKGTGLQVTHLWEDGTASYAGLCVGDLLIAIDGYVLTEKSFIRCLKRYQAEEKSQVSFIRDGFLLQRELVWQSPMKLNIKLELAEEQTKLPWAPYHITQHHE